jgi:formylglycine-generating enzyme required for sulfatase activity
MRDTLLPEMARIEAGEFVMGCDEGDEDERPERPVRLDEYYIGVYEVTNLQYAVFLREAGHRAPGLRELPAMVSPQSVDTFRQGAAPYVWKNGIPPLDREDHPVTLVQYEDAEAYCAWLAAVSGKPIRLPTEAEWERAARGGLVGRRYPWGDDIDPSRANFLPDPSFKVRWGTRPVGSYPPNNYRLHDMAGNVWEWVSGWYWTDVCASSDDADPAGRGPGVLRILRGGSWVNSDVNFLRCAYRHKVPPDTYAYSVGFRIACSSERA